MPLAQPVVKIKGTVDTRWPPDPALPASGCLRNEMPPDFTKGEVMMLNPDNPKHADADQRLRSEPIIWLTTVNGSGQPQSSPVWFLWDGSGFLIFGSKNGPKTPSIRANPLVSLHLDGDGNGGGNVIFEGTATVSTDGSAAAIPADYIAKYQPLIQGFGWTLDGMAADYPHVIMVAPARVRVW
jgi:PPOX class probable F420-dependent enzyme